MRVVVTGDMGLTPVPDVLRWCLTSLPNLYQTTAFGLTGLVILDMISKVTSDSPDLIFLDTLHHFDETLALVDRVRSRYPNTMLHVYKPLDAENADEFAERYGKNLWETNDEQYDWVAKVEPAQRAYRNLNVRAVLTGRRRSQGGKRGELDIIEIDEAGLLKINPLAGWDFERVRKYIDENDVPYNELLDRGYKSVGDWHSTQPTTEGEDERSGRWKGQQKTECGIHNKRSRYAMFLMEMQRKQEEEAAEKVDSGAETDDQALATAVQGLAVAC
jgi:phosphoadenosine phosphosulfate reductase